MPVVDGMLQLVASGEQRTIDRRQRRNDGFQALPELLGFETDLWQELLFDEIMEYAGDAQATLVLSIINVQSISSCLATGLFGELLFLGAATQRGRRRQAIHDRILHCVEVTCTHK